MPGVLLLVGLIVAAWKQKRGNGGPDLDGELLDVKARQYQSRARRGQWSPDPMFSEDPEFADYAALYSRVKPETKTAIDGWQSEWDAISAYWEKFFAGTDPMGAPPSDKWGIGDIARAHAAELLQGKLANFRAILHQLAEDPRRFNSLSPELQDLARSIEHIRSVLPSEEAEKILRNAFAGDEAMVGHIILDLKKQQYGELARAGRFDELSPEFAHDERYKPFTLIKPLMSEAVTSTINGNQAEWEQAAMYWQGQMEGDSAGNAPSDVLGISAAAAAALADMKRRERWERADQANGAESDGPGVSAGAALGPSDRRARADQANGAESDGPGVSTGAAVGASAAADKRWERWMKRQMEDENSGALIGRVDEGQGSTPSVEEPSKSSAAGLDAQLAKYFPDPQDRLIMKHTMAEEGPGKFGANWGGVVYRDGSGNLVCDRQWINFGLISFAYPSGAGVGVLKTLMSDPEEEKAFRAIAEQLLADNPGGEVKEGWRHLLRDPSNYTIPAMTKQEMINEFVAAIKSGNGRAYQDWMFKYLNTPVTKNGGIASGDMRDDWHSVLSAFLSRPASQATQLNTTRDQFFDAAVTAALDPKQFGLTSVRGVAFLFDVMVQSGQPTQAMKNLAATEEYQNASETRKLEMLRDTFRKGSTEWNRRNSVIKSENLTDDPYRP